MLCWEYAAPEAAGDSGTPCLELLNTSGWEREAGGPASWGGGASEDAAGGVLPSNTARSILRHRGEEPNTFRPRGFIYKTQSADKKI